MGRKFDMLGLCHDPWDSLEGGQGGKGVDFPDVRSPGGVQQRAENGNEAAAYPSYTAYSYPWDLASWLLSL